MTGIEIWSVPVPVRRSTFTGLTTDSEHYNIEADLSQIGSFGPSARSSLELLQADLQCNADGHVQHRLGSGRSGYYAGKYLKGVGRTPLAANWNSGDSYHSSGHLLPSGAAREFLVSCLFSAGGQSNTINCCETVLIADLKSSDKSWARTLRGSFKTCAADSQLQALSVKDGNFARLSNFLWGLNNFEARVSWLPEYLLAVRRHLTPHEHVSSTDVTPHDIVACLSQSFDRGCHNFGSFRRMGVHWGSFHNNFTADGRFLDLEIPLVLGEPIVGWVSRKDRDVREGKWVGLDASPFMLQFRDFVTTYRERLRGLPRHMFSDIGTRFLDELVRVMDETFGPHHPMFDTHSFAINLCNEVSTELGFGTAASRDLKIIILDTLQRRGRMSSEVWARLNMHEVAYAFPCAEGGADWVLRIPSSMIDRFDLRFATARLFQDSVARCDSSDSTWGYLEALQKGGSDIGSRSYE